MLYTQNKQFIYLFFLHKIYYIIYFQIFLQDLFSKQKGFLEEELDYRKQALDQAYMVWSLEPYELSLYTKVDRPNRQNELVYINYNIN